MNRINDLSERRRRLWSLPWERWERDFEARINQLTKLLEAAYVEKRRQRTADESAGSAHARRDQL